MADKYCMNKYDGGTFTGETRTVTQPSMAAIHGVRRTMAEPKKTGFIRGQPTKHISV